MPTPETALWRAGAFAADDWRFPAAGEPVPADGKVALPKARFLAERAALAGRNGPIGVVLESGESLADIEDDVPRFGLIVLRFARYADGRNYSTARILRDRLGFRGELRASGDVLRDQVLFMLRAGFDALEIAHAGTVATLKEGRIVGVHRHYQPASNEIGESAAGLRGWQRTSRRLASN
ncbi:MAG: DUF934 domain-containing protein [Rhodospirillales bacterium]|nr:DUF934 domain-containing protein [Rhodospirillales bacterium]